MYERRGFFTRLKAFIQGWFGIWMRDRETGNPRAVYESAIQQRMRQYEELKQAVAGILYMRNKLEAELVERHSEIGQVHQDIERSVRRGDDEVAVALITHRDSLQGDVERSQRELDAVRGEVDDARKNLVNFRSEIQQLEREKLRMLATLANSSARRRIQEALEGLSVDVEMRALDAVRENIGRLEAQTRVESEVEEGGVEERMRQIRSEARQEGARRELEELKRQILPAQAGPETVPAEEQREKVLTVAPNS